MQKQAYNKYTKVKPVRKYQKPKFDPVARQCAVTISFMTAGELAHKSGLCYETARRIINGKTTRPQNLTIDRLLYAAGFERKIIRKEE